MSQAYNPTNPFLNSGQDGMPTLFGAGRKPTYRPEFWAPAMATHGLAVDKLMSQLGQPRQKVKMNPFQALAGKWGVDPAHIQSMMPALARLSMLSQMQQQSGLNQLLPQAALGGMQIADAQSEAKYAHALRKKYRQAGDNAFAKGLIGNFGYGGQLIANYM